MKERIKKELHTQYYDYYGETLNNLPDGMGHMEYLGDDYFFSYDGYFSKGIEHGKGSQVCLDGTFVCEFVNGKRHGQGTCYYKDGTEFTGTWENDAPVQ